MFRCYTKAGTEFDDEFASSGRNDTIDGGQGKDKLNLGFFNQTDNVNINVDFTLTDNQVTGTNPMEVRNFESVGIIATGSGNDTISINDTDINFGSIDGGDGTDSVNGNFSNLDRGINYLGIYDIESVNITGTDYDDTLNGINKSDSLDGGAGTDYLELDLSSSETNDLNIETSFDGTSGQVIIDDTLLAIDNFEKGKIIGGSGNDTITLDYSTVSGSIYLDTFGRESYGNVFRYDTEQYIHYHDNIENVNITGTSFNDTLIGNSGNDRLDAGAGDDSISGGLGNDTILGGNGSDIITTGAGNDSVDGGAGIDTVLYDDVVYQGNSNISLVQTEDGVIYNNSDLLTNVEILQFGDAQVNAQTLEIIPTPNPIAEYGTISNLTHNKQTIDLINTYINPVVFVQPPSNNGGDPAIVRLDNITNSSFEAKIQEPNHLDDIHTFESASYFVFEAGSWQLPDGTNLEVGTNSSSDLVSQGFDSVEFDTEFATSPVVISTVQTNNGGDFVRTRQNNATSNGFSVAMEEEEALKDSGHATEEIGWLAIEPGSGAWGDSTYYAGQTGNSVTHESYSLDFNNLFDDTPQLMAGISSYDGADPGGLRYQNLNSDAVEIQIQEDTSYDSEIVHTTEVVDFLALQGSGILQAIPAPQQTIIGEVGTITNLNHNSQTIELNNTYTNPVVFAMPLSSNGGDPAVARITNINDSSFSIYVQEAEYLDGLHANENFSYVVIEAGVWELDNGAKIEVGSLDTDKITTESWESINFKSDFSDPPVVLSSVQTDNGTQFVRTRQRGKSVDGFSLSLEEEEALKDSGHATETVGWLAMETGGGSWSGFDYTAGSTAEVIDHEWDTVGFDRTFDTPPSFLASLSSYVGGDPAGLRYRNLGSSQVQIKVEEDTSFDSEIGHVNETVDFLAIAGTGNLSAISVDSFI